jgi:hypothetical protein
MPWASLGTVTLNWDWKSFSVPDVGGDTYRFRQRFTQGLIYPSGYFLFSWVYPTVGRYGSARKIWADNTEPTLIISPIPETLQERGLQTRYGSIKLPKSSRISQSNPWVVELQAETPIPPP